MGGGDGHMETSDTCLGKWTFCSDSVVQRLGTRLPEGRLAVDLFLNALNAVCAFVAVCCVVYAKLTAVPG